MKRLALIAFVLLGPAACFAPQEGDQEEEGATDDALTANNGQAACPTDARLSQGFGKGHDGIDLANSKGTPIFAVAGGVVTASGPAQGYGQWIRIKHDDGSMTEYGHMFERDVQVGARVTAGQQIALMGKEGNSTGPHLHLRAYKSAARTGEGNGTNPIDYLKARGISIPCKPGTVASTASKTPLGKTDTTQVTVWKDAELFSVTNDNGAPVGKVSANRTYQATCWKGGENIESDGYTNDRWVKLEGDDGTGFVSGIFLKGDETGGVTAQCE